MISRTIYINGVNIQLIFVQAANNDVSKQTYEILMESFLKGYR